MIQTKLSLNVDWKLLCLLCLAQGCQGWWALQFSISLSPFLVFTLSVVMVSLINPKNKEGFVKVALIKQAKLIQLSVRSLP